MSNWSGSLPPSVITFKIQPPPQPGALFPTGFWHHTLSGFISVFFPSSPVSFPSFHPLEQGPSNYDPWAKSGLLFGLFGKQSVISNNEQLCLCVSILSMAVFTLQEQGCVVTTEIIWPSKFLNIYCLALHRRSAPSPALGYYHFESFPEPFSLLVLCGFPDNSMCSDNFMVLTTLNPTASGQTSRLTFRCPCSPTPFTVYQPGWFPLSQCIQQK